MDWVYLASLGFSGGVLLKWDRRVVEKVKEFIGKYTMACSLKSMEDKVCRGCSQEYMG